MNLDRRGFLTLGAGALAAATCGCREQKEAVQRWIGVSTALTPEASCMAPQSGAIDDVSHLLHRLTFGARPGDYARAAGLGAAGFIEEQLAPEKIDDWVCDRLIRHRFDELSEPESHLFPRGGDPKDPIQQMFPALKDRGGRVGDLYEFKSEALLNSLTRSTVVRALTSRRQFFEVMVQFWSDHLNVDPSKGESKWLKVADDRDVVRAHALGNFRELIRASAISPAMLWYLDGRANRIHAPGEKANENYARELLELHTLGVHGGYTQTDVMEVARCLSGWTARDIHQRRKGKVEFNARDHDDGAKLVLGEAIPAGLGAGDLDRVLEIVVRHPSTARHLAEKLCRRFIADAPPEEAVTVVAQAFQASGGEIRTTLRALFATPEFMASRGGKLKRPFHFVVSALRAANAETDAGRPIVDALLRMGHAPFRYPTPDGYPETAGHWTNTLLWRWNFASSLAANRLPGTRIEVERLIENAGGEEELMAACLGRQPSERERTALRGSGAGLALVFSAPAFQYC